MRKTGTGLILRGALSALLLLAPLSPLTLTSCLSTHPELDITLESDFSDILQSIYDSNRSLTDKMRQIETSMQSGMADNQAAMQMIQAAVASLGGTMEE